MYVRMHAWMVRERERDVVRGVFYPTLKGYQKVTTFNAFVHFIHTYDLEILIPHLSMTA